MKLTLWKYFAVKNIYNDVPCGLLYIWAMQKLYYNATHRLDGRQQLTLAHIEIAIYWFYKLQYILV